MYLAMTLVAHDDLFSPSGFRKLFCTVQLHSLFLLVSQITQPSDMMYYAFCLCSAQITFASGHPFE